jgi:hypothetical protein
MKQRFLLIYLILTIILQGCVSHSELTLASQTSGVTTPSLVAETSIFTAIPRPTFTLTPFLTPTYIPTITLTSSHQAVHQSCLTVLPATPEGKIYLGKLILEDPPIVYRGRFIYSYDLSTHQTTIMPPKEVVDFAASSDGTKYIVLDNIDRKLKVYSADGAPLETLTPRYPYISVDRWLDNDHIILALQSKYPFDEEYYDIHTGEQMLLRSDYPDIDTSIDQTLNNTRWEGYSTTKYDASLTRVVYPGLIESEESVRGSGYILWDRVNKVKLAQIISGDFSRTPIWSPDGSKFVIFNQIDGEFNVITRDGAVSRNSQLNSSLNNKSKVSFFFTDTYSWSPDGRYLAFWLESESTGVLEAAFAILDTSTGETTDYCISAGSSVIENYPRSTLPTYLKPIWSPDGKLVATTANLGENGFDTILIDLAGGFSAKIAQNLIPVGWLDIAKK